MVAPFGSYEVVLHKRTRKFLRRHPDLESDWEAQEGIREQLSQRPLVGPRIDHLKGPLHCSRRWRAGDYRLLYDVDEATKEVFVYTADNRGDVYGR